MLQPIMQTSNRGTREPAAQGGLSPEETAALRPVVSAVVACVLKKSKDHPDVEDCTHEVLSRAIEGRARLRDGEPLRPWVIGIARHVALDVLRKTRRSRIEVSSSEANGPDSSPGWLDRLVDPAPGPEERTASAQQLSKLEGVLVGLTEEQRSALVLFHVEGLGYQQIAERLGVPLGTVATWISRGRRSIASALAE